MPITDFFCYELNVCNEWLFLQQFDTPFKPIVVTDLETEIIGEKLMGRDAATVAWAFMSKIEGTNLGMGPVYMEGVSGREITTGDDGVVWIPVAYWFAAD